jgi:hypothetical protein
MGTGICAAIPIVIKTPTYKLKYFSDNFLDGYTFDEENQAYLLKEELLVDNYLPFLKEFYHLIGEPINIDDVPIATNFSDFEIAFEKDKRKPDMPFLYGSEIAFRFLGGCSSYYWLFYFGSYKAMLEEYITLLHFERVLAKAMENPLAGFIKLGIFG